MADIGVELQHMDNRVGHLAEQIIAALKLPVMPGSIEINFSADGRAQSVVVHAVGWKRKTGGG